MRPRTGRFEHEGHRLAYSEYGEGPPVVMLPGLLFSRRLNEPLAQAVAARGYRVLTLDPLGHGDSDRPRDMWKYSMTAFGREVIGLLDHLEIERAVVGGPSLGANITLEAAVAAPKRIQGLIVEMPVLDNALLGCALAFTPMMVALTFGERLTRLGGRVLRLVPRGTHPLADSLLDWGSQDPAPSAAVLQGLFFGRVAPPREDRRGIEAPALVIGHSRDPVHPFSDSGMLASELPNARLIEASSILELRLTPERLTGEITRFVDSCWQPAPARPRRARAAS